MIRQLLVLIPGASTTAVIPMEANNGSQICSTSLRGMTVGHGEHC